ncbi:hypothetical protein E1H99_05550 [Enterococcus hirae]|nr:hypothetical protein E1H99_05550 [Enterococcus hirae]
MSRSKGFRSVFHRTKTKKAESASTVKEIQTVIQPTEELNEVEKELINLSKRYLEKGEVSTSEKAFKRIKEAQALAKELENSTQAELKTAMARFYYKNFYLSDYLYIWLNLDCQKLRDMEKSKPIAEGSPSALYYKDAKKELQQIIKIRFESLKCCFERPEINRQLDGDSMEEIVERIRAVYFSPTVEVERYLKYEEAQLKNPSLRLSKSSSMRVRKSEKSIDEESVDFISMKQMDKNHPIQRSKSLPLSLMKSSAENIPATLRSTISKEQKNKDDFGKSDSTTYENVPRKNSISMLRTKSQNTADKINLAQQKQTEKTNQSYIHPTDIPRKNTLKNSKRRCFLIRGGIFKKFKNKNRKILKQSQRPSRISRAYEMYIHSR